jgi:hypothetical protein
MLIIERQCSKNEGYSGYYCNGGKRGCGGVPPRRGFTPAPRTSPEWKTLYILNHVNLKKQMLLVVLKQEHTQQANISIVRRKL